MTPLSHPDGRLLIAKWRQQADQLEALLASAVPVEEAALMDLEPIKARVVAATKGPWIVSGLDRADGERWVVFDGGRGEDSSLLQDQDAEFIAHARTDIPALIAEIERLRASPGPVAGAEHQDLLDECIPRVLELLREAGITEPDTLKHVLEDHERWKKSLVAGAVPAHLVECSSPDFSGGRCRNCGLGNDAHVPLPSPPRSEQDETQEKA